MGVEAIARYGAPEVFNTDEGSQFTNGVFTCKLQKHDMRISMDGKGIWTGNVVGGGYGERSSMKRSTQGLSIGDGSQITN
jgi:hypothetical protein